MASTLTPAPGRALSILVVFLSTAPVRAARADPEPALRRLVAPMLDDHPERAVVVGVLGFAGAPTVYGFGSVRAAFPQPPDGRTEFEIGSVTKLFTAVLLADMVARAEVRESDAVRRYLPAGITLPDGPGRPVALGDLATHASGLPRDAVPPWDLVTSPDPFGDYTVADLGRYLATWRPQDVPGTRVRYSNTGFAILGLALAHRLGMSYEAALTRRVLEPMGLNDTHIASPSAGSSRVARGYNLTGWHTPAWGWRARAFAPAGALRSDARDLLRFLAQFREADPSTSWGRALLSTLRPRGPFETPGAKLGLGWILIDQEGTTVAVHDGRTSGHSAFVAWCPGTRRGVVILANFPFDPVAGSLLGGALHAVVHGTFDGRQGLVRRLGVPPELTPQPVFRMDRVETVHAGIAVELAVAGRADGEVHGGYSTGPGRWEGGASIGARWGSDPGDRIAVTYRDETVPSFAAATMRRDSRVVAGALTNPLPVVPTLIDLVLADRPRSNTLRYLTGEPDYFDYYHSAGFSASVAAHSTALHTTVRVTLTDERHTSVSAATTGAPFRDSVRANPPVDAGRMRSVAVAVLWNALNEPRSSVGRPQMVLELEHAAPPGLGGDFRFTRWGAELDWRLPLPALAGVPQDLDVRLVGSTATGVLPRQRFAVFEPQHALIVLGTLRTLDGRPVEGDRAVGLFWEYDVRRTPFGGRAELILYGGHARTWIPADRLAELTEPPRTTEGWYREVGLSVNGLLSLFRVDVTTRLGGPGTALTITVPKPY